ncbi:MAG: hypothetical protein ABEH43_09345 [Flavobacteriales bacterium]
MSWKKEMWRTDNNEIEYVDLHRLRKNRYRNIPNGFKGNYYFFYAPKLNPYKDSGDFLLEFKNATKKFVLINEKTDTHYFTLNLLEKGFWDFQNNCWVGLSQSRQDILKDYLKTQRNRIDFCSFFEWLCFQRPFYIGKSIDVKQRVYSHLQNDSKIYEFLVREEILFKDITVGFKPIETECDEKILNVFEEIAQTFIKPPLVEKPG